MNQTSIEWAEKTWNPTTGCTPVSEGCANCYARRMAQRLRGRYGYPADEPFKVTLHPEKLEEPLKLRKPSRIFVCSMSDLFHEDVPFEFIDQVFGVMAMARKHTFMVLTKRPQRLLEYARSRTRETGEGYLNEGNVWLGVTAENQDRADERIPTLLQVPAAVRFVSVEPMLGPVDLSKWLVCKDCARWDVKPGYDYSKGLNCGLPQLNWVICGGETGPNARPMHPDWVRGLRNQCQGAGVPCMFKQWGEWCGGVYSCDSESNPHIRLQNGQTVDTDAMFADSGAEEDTWFERKWHQFSERTAWSDPLTLYSGECGVRTGKKAAGRLLDGREWNEYPEVNTNAHI